LWAIGAMLFMASVVVGLDRVGELQGHFDKENHASAKVKALDKLAEAQFEATRKAGAANDFVTVGLILEKYRDNVRACLELLKKQEPDADRHPGSYRQLELQTRKGLREVEDAMLIAPMELRPPLEIVRKDILDMDGELIHLLFPRRSQDQQNMPPLPEAKP
jgi:hypothetical protein